MIEERKYAFFAVFGGMGGDTGEIGFAGHSTLKRGKSN